MVTGLIVAGLAWWFLLSVLNQWNHGKLIRRIKQRDSFSLIPIWTFFAPRPGVTDFNVLYRDASLDGRFGPWREVAPLAPRWFRGVWNPQKRLRKGITDICNTLLKIAVKKPGKRMYVQLPYLTLLHYVCEAPRTQLTYMRQFAIVRTYGYHTDRKPTVLYTSGAHKLESPSSSERPPAPEQIPDAITTRLPVTADDAR